MNCKIIFILLLLGISLVNGEILSSSAERTCQGQSCSLSLYSFTKFYKTQEVWTSINENILSQSCAVGFSYCVLNNLYQAQFKPMTTKVVQGQHSMTMVLESMGTSSSVVTQQPTVSVAGNQFVQENMFSNVTVRQTYLPEKLKEEVVLVSMPSLPAAQTLNIKYLFELSNGGSLRSGSVIIDPQNYSEAAPFVASGVDVAFNNQVVFILPQLVAEDSLGQVVAGSYALYGNGSHSFVDARFPYTWLSAAQYPVTIDPTIALNASNMTWNGYVQYNSTHYFRVDNPFVLKVGHFFRNVTTFIDDRYRSVLEFDTSTVPQSASIQKIDLTLFSTQAGTTGNNNISIHPLEKNNTQYTTENQSCLGNCNHYTDAGNGTLFVSKNTSAGFNTFNLDASITEFYTALQSRSWFSYGLTSHDGESQQVHGNQDARIASKDYPTPNNRPLLNITYILNPANESDGRIAIEVGINNTINTSIITNQQIYTANWSANTQTLTTFDKYTQRSNQSRAFNYVTSGESFTNLATWLNRLIIWENTTLTTDQITNQVQGIITNTTI